jgi:hypothetical protein
MHRGRSDRRARIIGARHHHRRHRVVRRRARRSRSCWQGCRRTGTHRARSARVSRGSARLADQRPRRHRGRLRRLGDHRVRARRDGRPPRTRVPRHDQRPELRLVTMLVSRRELLPSTPEENNTATSVGVDHEQRTDARDNTVPVGSNAPPPCSPWAPRSTRRSCSQTITRWVDGVSR